MGKQGAELGGQNPGFGLCQVTVTQAPESLSPRNLAFCICETEIILSPEDDVKTPKDTRAGQDGSCTCPGALPSRTVCVCPSLLPPPGSPSSVVYDFSFPHSSKARAPSGAPGPCPLVLFFYLKSSVGSLPSKLTASALSQSSASSPFVSQPPLQAARGHVTFLANELWGAATPITSRRGLWCSSARPLLSRV